MIHYRRAGLSDIPELVRLRVDFLKEVTGAEEEPAIGESLQQYFTEHLPAGDCINWVAVDDKAIVGTGGICFYSIPPNFWNVSGRRAYILNVYTEKAYRRQGIAKRIFRELMAEAQRGDVLQVSLHATSEGRKLYEQFGFKAKDNEMVWEKRGQAGG